MYFVVLNPATVTSHGLLYYLLTGQDADRIE